MSETIISSGAIVIMMMFITYMVLGSLLEKNHCVIGHEASIIILLGSAISFGFWYLGHEDFNKMMTFDENFFFYFCLPPIIFASGYNMKRKKFFENFSNIIIFGVLGTVVQFTLFSFFTVLVMKTGLLEKYNPETGYDNPLILLHIENTTNSSCPLWKS
jgi:NhaP-type Na+/H+ or K+/H+ antiporter